MKKPFLLSIAVTMSVIQGVCASELAGFVSIPASDGVSPFYIGRYPVTNGQYQEFVEETKAKTPKYWKVGTYPDGKKNHPVVFVSYSDVQAYCKWLEKKYPDYSFRLPTMEEWEYAASGGENKEFPWGKRIDESKFNYNKLVASVYLKQNPTVTYSNEKSERFGESMPLNQIISINEQGGVSGWIDHRNHTGFVYTDLFEKIMDNGGYTTPVEQYENGKSVFGVYDMSGNVWEWTSTLITAQNGAEKGQQVYAVKGGSWYANPNSCKITMQGEGRRPNTGYNTVGFRVVAQKTNQLSDVKKEPDADFTEQLPFGENGKIRFDRDKDKNLPFKRKKPVRKPKFKPDFKPDDKHVSSKQDD